MKRFMIFFAASGCVAISAIVMFVSTGIAASQQPGQGAEHQTQNPHSGDNINPRLFFREEWRHTGALEHPITLDSVSNPNLEMKLYGDPPKPDPDFDGIWLNKRREPADDPPHIFTGTCRRPCGLTLRDRKNFVDLSGFAKFQWLVNYEGFHTLRPLLKLADGIYLVGDHTDRDTNSYQWHVRAFSLADLRWRRLDPDKVVTMTGAQAGWVDAPDLSKVDEIGFVDLMPGSGHGRGGWADLGWLEVYGKPVPR